MKLIFDKIDKNHPLGSFVGAKKGLNKPLEVKNGPGSFLCC